MLRLGSEVSQLGTKSCPDCTPLCIGSFTIWWVATCKADSLTLRPPFGLSDSVGNLFSFAAFGPACISCWLWGRSFGCYWIVFWSCSCLGLTLWNLGWLGCLSLCLGLRFCLCLWASFLILVTCCLSASLCLSFSCSFCPCFCFCLCCCTLPRSTSWFGLAFLITFLILLIPWGFGKLLQAGCWLLSGLFWWSNSLKIS